MRTSMGHWSHIACDVYSAFGQYPLRTGIPGLPIRAIHPIQPYRAAAAGRMHETPIAHIDSHVADAAAAAEKALLLLSQNLNKGISQVDNAGQEIDKVNNILNKHLND